MRIALLITCVTDTLFPDTGRATVTLLERLGHTVVFPAQQTCCGQMHINTGHQDQALPLIRRLVRLFGDADAIVAPSGSCVASVREQYARVAEQAGDERLLAEVHARRPRVHELTRLLVDELGVEDVGAAFPHRVTYHPSCHGHRLLPSADAPLHMDGGLARASASVRAVQCGRDPRAPGGRGMSGAGLPATAREWWQEARG